MEHATGAILLRERDETVSIIFLHNYLYNYCGLVISVIINVSKKYIFDKWVFEKTRGGGLTSVVQNYFDKGV